SKLPGSGRYVYLHVMVPHGPVAFDSECRFIPPGEMKRKPAEAALDDHYACAVTIIERITRRLRELGRLDNSLVIVHADHGTTSPEKTHRWNSSFPYNAKLNFVDRNKEALDEIPSQQIASLANVLFLVHRPGQTKFSVSPVRVQLLDVAPTVLDYFGADSTGLQGASLLDRDIIPTRPIVYYETRGGAIKNQERMARYERRNGVWSFVEWSHVKLEASQLGDPVEEELSNVLNKQCQR
ncbi:MAG: sulfatase-like hydrolase/transferase, partial [Pseudaminobacter sp.]|nr:sulfatase-like hydrolase/transferase [Pseudaminobacter sp.]